MSVLVSGTSPYWIAQVTDEIMTIGAATTITWTGTSVKTSGGTYTGSVNKTFTFTVRDSGTAGTDTVNFDWSDGVGGTGTVTFTAGNVNTFRTVAEGVTVRIAAGTVVEDDTFSIAVTTGVSHKTSLDNSGRYQEIEGLTEGAVVMAPEAWSNIASVAYIIYGALDQDGTGKVALDSGEIEAGVVKHISLGMKKAKSSGVHFNPLPFLYIDLVITPTSHASAHSATITTYIMHQSQS